MFTSVQTTEDLERLLQDLRERLTGGAAFPIHVEGGAADENRQIETNIRERLVAGIAQRCRTSFGPDYPEFRRRRRVSVQVPRRAPSARLAEIVESEIEGVVGPSTSVHHAVSERGIDVETATSHVRTASPEAAVAREGECTYPDPGGDDLNDWEEDIARFEAQYGRPVPWKPGWQEPPPDPGTGAPRSTWTLAVYLDNAPFNIARLDVFDARSYALATNEFIMGLANDTSWAKRATYWQSCVGPVVAVAQAGRSSVPDEKRILVDLPPYPPSPIPTMVFRKPGFLGRWHDVGHFALFKTRFTDLFAETRSIFTWVVD